MKALCWNGLGERAPANSRNFLGFLTLTSTQVTALIYTTIVQPTELLVRETLEDGATSDIFFLSFLVTVGLSLGASATLNA